MSITVTRRVHFSTGLAGQKRLRKGNAAKVPTDRIPRISRLMALAIYFDQLIREGKVKDYAELARLGHVTRARVTQVMNLLSLAPAIQEELLFLSRSLTGSDNVHLIELQDLTTLTDWTAQRKYWRETPRHSSHPSM